MQGVILNICIDTEETRALGLENHVCELQLITDGIYAVQVCRCKNSFFCVLTHFLMEAWI